MRLRGRSLHLGNIRTHNHFYHHCQVCSAADEDARAAPVATDLDATLKHAALGHHNGNGGTALAWCMSEAVQDADREFPRGAEAITIQLEERNKMLPVKLQACDANLSGLFSVLGQLRNAIKTTPQIASAAHEALRGARTERVLHQRCNPWRSGAPPFRQCGRGPRAPCLGTTCAQCVRW